LQEKGKTEKGKKEKQNVTRTLYVSLNTRAYRPKPILERKEQKTLVSKEMAKTHGLRYQIPEIARKGKQKNVLAVYVFGPRLETVSTVVVLTFFLLDRISRTNPYVETQSLAN